VVVEKLRQAMGEMLRPLVDARSEASKALANARAAKTEADKKLAEKPDDEALKTAATAAQDAVAAAEKTHAEAEKAVDAARRTFDLEAELAKVTQAKLQVVAVPEPKNADGLKELPEFGPWDASWVATSIELPGDVCARVQNTKPAVFLFQVLDVVKSPLKDFASIRDKLAEDYYKKKADAEAKTILGKFEDALKRLAREAKKADIEKIEADLAAEVSKKFGDWQAATEAKKTRAKDMLATLADDPHSRPYKDWQAELELRERELGDPEAKKKAIEAEARKAADAKIDEIVKAARKDVLAAAAAEAGLTVDTIGPVRRDVDALPRFQEDRPAREKFLLANFAVKQLEEGQASDMLEDFTDRAHHMVLVQKIEPGSIDLLRRHEIVAARAPFERERSQQTLQQSFTLEALRAGWGYRRAEGEPDEAKSARSGPAGKQAPDGKAASGGAQPAAVVPDASGNK
jgi:hypothetical protein